MADDPTISTFATDDLKTAIGSASGAYVGQLDAAVKGALGTAVLDDLMRAHKGIFGGSELARRLTELSNGVGASSHLGKLTEQMERQLKSIDALKAYSMPPPELRPLRLPDITLPDNPIHETNDRLKNIEVQFESLQRIAVQGAEIATGLHAYAAEFLQKFERAASDTERSANKAVRVSYVAIALTVVAALFPLVYDVFWRSPADAQTAQLAMDSLRGEVRALADSQEAIADSVASSLDSSSDETVKILEEIRNLLAVPRDDVTDPPDSTDEIRE